MKFTGTFEELKEKLSALEQDGEWNDLNENQKQFKHKNGSILNWYPSTGTVNFQGKNEVSEILKISVNGLLKGDDDTANPVQTDLNNLDTALKDSIPGKQTIQEKNITKEEHYFDDSYPDSELIIGLVGAVGTNLSQVTTIIRDRLRSFNYNTDEIRISQQIIKEFRNVEDSDSDYTRISTYMTEGNKIREKTGDYSILALATAAKINEIRTSQSGRDQPAPFKRKAFIINSLKNPEEVHRFRKIYSSGFFLIGVYADEKRRFNYLTKNLKNISEDQASELIERDQNEIDDSGQHTQDTFHLSDFFVHFDGNSDKFQNDLWRILDLMFGRPYVTPTFDEFAMFMAFSASLRSADLSRQIGAVVAKDKNIVATGANDIPKAGGGLYWPEYNEERNEIIDAEDGRDYKRGEDSNAKEKQRIIQDILEKVPKEHREVIEGCLKKSRIKDITEYGRVVHAEMEAILACARNNISTMGAAIYCTTFPCHNCAKHITLQRYL
ncbi:cytidine deaminase [bacterium]|nr:cytidine deaminase [bacterium]